MPLVLRKNIMGAELLLWRVDETEEELAALVTPEDAASAVGFASPVRRLERLAWRAALREAGITGAVAYTTAGAPYLEGSNTHISVSHCKSMVCVALSPRRCGVDIEPEGRDCSRAADRFVSDSERLLLEGLPNPEAAMWCAKEALYKYAGCDGLDFIRDIRITGREGGFRAAVDMNLWQAVVGGESALVCLLHGEGCLIAVVFGAEGR